MSEQPSNDIAVIGMVGRFPGARTLDEFWRNLRDGVESVRIYSRDELRSHGIDEHLLEDPRFVAAEAVLDDVDRFDAAFFGYAPREAEIMDPQQRLYLEASWELLESAGYCPDKYDGRIAVYAGSALSTYLIRNLGSNPEIVRDVGTFKIMLANDKDFLATKVSYKLGLTGPSVNVNTLCSSSALAVHFACESLLSYHSDMALAGGISLQITRNEGFFYQEGGIGSADGHCRAYDEKASGTVSGSGLGILLLKRLADAVADGDRILAVIKGSAVNNDGSDKASYTAPNPEGQAECIAEAIELANVEPDTITYIEGHGTGTKLGDPIEVQGLTRAFRKGTDRRQFCYLGSVKTNIGHLVTAGGVASLVKTILCLQHRQIAPSLNFDKANPNIDFANSPFMVCTRLTPWNPECGVRRAGVSSFGIGGTNVHIILEEAPAVAPAGPGTPPHAVMLSAKSAAALEAMERNLSTFLAAHPETNLADLSYTLQVGRKDFAHRKYFIADDSADLRSGLLKPGGDSASMRDVAAKPIVLMFPGQGAQYTGMARAWYDAHPAFRTQLDELTDLYRAQTGIDLAPALLDAGSGIDLTDTRRAQPALFMVELALAKLLAGFGVEATAMIGHSIGEYTAACLAGVFGVEDALRLIHLRAQVMAEAPPGAMLAIPLPEGDVRPLLPEGASIAAINAEQSIVASGPTEAIARLERELAGQGVHSTRLATSHAFHSAMMSAAADQLARAFRQVELREPTRRFLSNLSGTWITAEQATSPEYWARHLLSPVLFKAGLDTLAGEGDWLYVEAGPGRALGGFVAAHRETRTAARVQCMPTAREAASANRQRVKAIADLWLLGTPIRWPAVYAGQVRRRLCLPTYPFDRKRYWIPERRWPHSSPGQGASFIEPASVTDPAPAGDPEPVAVLRDNIRSPYRAPVGEVQETLVSHWEQVLGVRPIGVLDNFFELGGHSLLAAALATRLRSVFDLEIPLPELLESPTIEQLSRLIETRRWLADGAAVAAASGDFPEQFETGEL